MPFVFVSLSPRLPNNKDSGVKTFPQGPQNLSFQTKDNRRGSLESLFGSVHYSYNNKVQKNARRRWEYWNFIFLNFFNFFLFSLFWFPFLMCFVSWKEHAQILVMGSQMWRKTLSKSSNVQTTEFLLKDN